MKYISLGLSCQSRMSFDSDGGNQMRGPLDYCITEKSALIDGLLTKGESFQHNRNNSSIYTMPKDRREGVRSNGVYFWHDYVLDGLRVEENWQRRIGKVNEKYAFLWRRFLEVLSSPEPKTFIVSSTQENLVQFASDEDEFDGRFGIDGIFIGQVAEALATLCGGDFSLVAMVRTLREADAIRAQSSSERVLVRFCGPMGLPTHPLIGGSFEALTQRPSSDRIGELEGIYDSGAKIERAADDALRIYRRNGADWSPWGECYDCGSHYLAAFQSPRTNQVFSGAYADGRLEFSNNSSWVKQ